MKNFSMKMLAKLLERSEVPGMLKAIEKLLTVGIPFNGPHGFKLKELSHATAKMTVPFKRANKNHLGTVHACAIATLGEFPAGVLLIKNFDPSKHRVVMTNMEAVYHKHGVGELTGQTNLDGESAANALSELNEQGVALIDLTTEITDSDGRQISTITTHWQLKRWNLVKKR